ncbi:hypothetical protein EQM14_04375 [Caproiciproducens sp. NJN-50]|uniref:hypothetical protein n=1 Tax=Acutalibacteraceae TaxID=3082771 RepID=UPI000FFE04BF|nr:MULTISPECIES: hypothetical protein [Acutalibacteraceae]QAT49069.1 hypothetical protein EQM14_04375 [Caproiciproducens sp. NJN-50]
MCKSHDNDFWDQYDADHPQETYTDEDFFDQNPQNESPNPDDPMSLNGSLYKRSDEDNLWHRVHKNDDELVRINRSKAA